MLLIILGLLVGLAVLVWSADRFVEGAVSISGHLGISPLVIGVIVIGFGTSAPELLVSAISALEGNHGLALGNAIGSNIANIALILGATALLTPLLVAQPVIERDFTFLFIATAALFYTLFDAQLTQIEGFCLVILLFVLLSLVVFLSRRNSAAVANTAITEETQTHHYDLKLAIFWTVIGLLLLLGSSRLLVWSAVELALHFGVSDVVIGLTIVAIGTSLPELAASITGALKHHTDLAVGNVVGSNIFNTLGVVGLSAAISPYAVPDEVLSRDMPIMLLLTSLLFVFAIATKNKRGMYKRVGLVFVTSFIAYQLLLYIQATG